jgi:hypothetical protein
MVGRQRHLVGAAVTTAVLGLGLTAVPAQATPIGLYDCQNVSYVPILINKPVNGFDCAGPVGPAPPGSVYEIPTGKRYSCQQLTGTVMSNGSLWVHGNSCEPF